MGLRKEFDDWGNYVETQYAHKQWLLSRWEVCEGIDWPDEKIDVMINTIKSGLSISEDDQLLDVGCGGGWILNALTPFVRTGIGLDFSLPMLNNAVALCKNNSFVCADMERIPFKDNSFDSVLCYFVLINFSDETFIANTIREIVRILKPGKRALIGQLPVKGSSYEYDTAKKEYLAYCAKEYLIGKSLREVNHMPQNLFDKEELTQMLNKEGIAFSFADSFNPFYRPGQSPTVSWRFDLILTKA